MRSARVLYFVVPLVVAALLAPVSAQAVNISPATSLVCAAGLGGFGFAQETDCRDLAREADNAFQDWRNAYWAAEGVAAVYGRFSVEYVAAALYRNYKHGQWTELRDNFASHCLDV